MDLLAYSDYDTGSAAAFYAVMALVYGILFIVAIAGYVIGSFFMMKVFEKAGVQGKWRAWVPVYNTLIFAKLGDLSPWWLLILWGATIVLGWVPVIGSLIGLAAYVYLILAAYRVQTKLGKQGPWIILYIFLAIVWLGIMAFDKSRWNTAVAPAPWANNFLADKTVWSGVPVQPTAAAAYPPAAPGAYPPPAGYQAPPAGYQPPAPGYAAPPAPAAPATPPPAAPPATPPAVPPTGAGQPPVAPPSNEPPAAPDAPRP
jgi:hypothetical protein